MDKMTLENILKNFNRIFTMSQYSTNDDGMAICFDAWCRFNGDVAKSTIYRLLQTSEYDAEQPEVTVVAQRTSYRKAVIGFLSVILEDVFFCKNGSTNKQCSNMPFFLIFTRTMFQQTQSWHIAKLQGVSFMKFGMKHSLL